MRRRVALATGLVGLLVPFAALSAESSSVRALPDGAVCLWPRGVVKVQETNDPKGRPSQSLGEYHLNLLDGTRLFDTLRGSIHGQVISFQTGQYGEMIFDPMGFPIPYEIYYSATDRQAPAVIEAVGSVSLPAPDLEGRWESEKAACSQQLRIDVELAPESLFTRHDGVFTILRGSWFTVVGERDGCAYPVMEQFKIDGGSICVLKAE